MASLNFCLCLFITIFVFFIVAGTESLSLDPYLETKKKNITSTLLRELLQKSKEKRKLGFYAGDDVAAAAPPSHYHTMRQSPGGPDPRHH
ncbi:hypothetical protein COP2_041699 [Malus domestica]